MSGAGFGAGGWGAVPWGGDDQLLPLSACDIFLFDSDNMDGVLTAPFVEATGNPAQLVLDYPNPPGSSNDLGLLSGDATNLLFPTSNAYITAFVPLNDEYTVELTVTLEELPNDFTDVSGHHVMFGATDMAGPCAAVFLSKIGLAYAGAVHHMPAAPSLSGNLVLDSSLQVIPATSSYTPLGVSMTYRLSVSGLSGAVYLYATPTADLIVTGHQLVAVLPAIDASNLVFPPPADRALISVRGTSPQPSRVAVDRWCLSSFLDIPNIIPIANAGQDQAVRACSVAQLDGSASFDPEGAPLLYFWRLVDVPAASELSEEGSDGNVYSIAPFTGFTPRFHSNTLAAIEADDPIQLGDVLLLNGVPRSIVGKAVDGNGFHVQVPVADIPYPQSGATFKLIRQRGLPDSQVVTPTFFADVPGFYKFDLVVFDGALFSTPSVVILNVLESVLPRGCLPNTDFVLDYIGDFWKMVEGIETIPAVWSAISQVAATELYTLWQHEYSKSLKDIQRTIVRRWLHYDLLLAEPLPELTQIRAIWSGVQSVNLPAVGNPGVVGFTLVLTSPVFEDSIIVAWVGAITSQIAALELRNRLLEIDERFSVTALTSRDGTFVKIRIDAPFPFTVSSSSTTSAFTPGVVSSSLSGTGAAAGGAKTYVVDRSLAGLDIREDDLLVIDGTGYRINRVVSGTPFDPDAFDQQRLTLKDDLPVPVGSNWNIASTVKSELLDFYNGMVSVGDTVLFEVVSSEEGVEPVLVQSTVLGVAASMPSVLGIDAGPIGTALSDETQTVYLAKCVRRTYLPVSDLLADLPALQEHIAVENDEATLRRNVDYFIDTFRGAKALRFMSTPPQDVWENVVPPDRLWAEYSYIDNRPTIEANFGVPAGLTLDDLAGLPVEVDYLSAVSGIWYAFFNGPRPDNIRIGAQIFLALPFAEETGTIEEIRSDFSPSSGRFLIRDSKNKEIVRSYSYPNALGLETNPTTGTAYAVGDVVSQFAPLVKGVEVIDSVKDSTWFQGLISQGIFHEIQKFHTFTVRVDSETFDLSALLLVRDFVLTLRPTYTYPVIVVALNIKPEKTELSITDTLKYKGSLILNESPCSQGTTMWDDAEPGTDGGAFWNQYDADESAPPPTYPVSESPIAWGFDKGYLCPSDSLVANLTYVQAAPGDALFDTFLSFDTELTQAIQGSITGISIPSPPGEVTVVSDTSIFNGDLRYIKLFVVGGDPTGLPSDYELVVEVNGVDTIIEPFTADSSVFQVIVNTVTPVLLSDTVTVKVRIPAASPDLAPRSPPWTTVTALVTIHDGAWDFDDTVAAGTYFISIPL